MLYQQQAYSAHRTCGNAGLVNVLQMYRFENDALLYRDHICSGFVSNNASKHGVIGYTRSFQFKPYIFNVCINALCPYWVETALLSGTKGSDDTQELFYNIFQQSPHVPMEIVVDSVLTLLNDKTRNTETLLATPEGIVAMETLQQRDSFHSKKSNATFKNYIKDAILPGQAQLATTLRRYESSYSKL
ncbi:hypothetical protein [Parasitella parasitica]|uniref:Uncharacterized protein n=1 Tax=Parasitella parasitica TaxID=35722 RepID=A0A0B7NEL6_9FUNG|nr:hypothetical protein [Parasitella parasitica]